VIEIRNINEQFTRASARAAAGNLTAEPSTLIRQYLVTNDETGAVYRVDFFRAHDGRRFVTCECAGGQGGHICKHAAMALPVHIRTMRASHAAARAAADKAFGDFVEVSPLMPAELLGDFSGLGDDDDPARSYRSH
jgi:hypothetical protein